MNEQSTIILTTRDSVLLETIQASLGGSHLVTIGSEPPKERINGRIWCFVDWLLPSISGLELCRRLRAAPATAHSHITLVLDEDDSEIRRRALRAGADDYLTGPLTKDLILDRLRQSRSIHADNHAPTRLRNGEITLDLAAHQLRYRRRIVPLRPNEFRLMSHFVEQPDQLFTRHQLIAMLGKDCNLIDERTVDVWVGRLRRSLKAHGVPDQLRTVRSMGYVMDSFEESLDANAA